MANVFSKERDRTVDAAKGLGVLLVFVGHAVEVAPGAEARAIFKAIYAFHMPMFFFLSGWVLLPTLQDPRPFGQTLRHVLRRLGWPYFAFGTLFLVGAFGQQRGWEALANPESYFALTNALLNLASGNPAPGVVIWFLYATAVVRLALAVAAPLIRGVGAPALAMLTTTAWVYLAHRFPEAVEYRPNIYLQPQSLLAFTAMTLLGATLRAPFEALLGQPLRPAHRATFMASLGAATVLLGRLNVPLPYTAFGDYLTQNPFAPVLAAGAFGSPLVLLACGVSGTLMTLQLAREILPLRAGAFFAKAGERSLGVFCLNGISLAFLNAPTAAWLTEQFGADATAPLIIVVAILQWRMAVALVGIYRWVLRPRVRRDRREPAAETLSLPLPKSA